MDWFIYNFLLGGTIYNWVFILCGLGALVRASRLEPYRGFLVTGLLLNAIPYLGFLAGLKRNPELYGSQVGTTIEYLIYLAIFLVLMIYACSKSYKKAAEKAENEKAASKAMDEGEKV